MSLEVMCNDVVCNDVMCATHLAMNAHKVHKLLEPGDPWK